MLIDSLTMEDELDEERESDPLDPFLAEGLITEVLGELKSGKEGTVYCCRANPSTGFDLLAVKVYRSRGHRSFKNDAVYREGIPILNGHDARAVRKKSDWGKKVEFGSWLLHEYDQLKELSEAGADVPKPLALRGNAMLMQFIGDENGAASKLQEVRLSPDEVRPLFDRVLTNVELFLRLDKVHGDLSPYNILYHQGVITIIDFPQTVDPRQNHNACALLERDLENVCRYWSRYGVRSDPARMCRFLWQRYQYAEL